MLVLGGGGYTCGIVVARSCFYFFEQHKILFYLSLPFSNVIAFYRSFGIPMLVLRGGGYSVAVAS